MKTALITGITGQDGYYLSEFLLEKNYTVFGLVRPESWATAQQGDYLRDKIKLVCADLTNAADIDGILQQLQPDEIYNLASQSRPSRSWERDQETLLINGMSAARLFNSARNICPAARIYQASSSEMFGCTSVIPQNETTPFNPMSPYAAAKIYAHQMALMYRERYASFISCGILFNHESERRPLDYVTQKIAYGAACAAVGIKNSPLLNESGNPIVAHGKLALGNLNIARDWGHASDYVRAMWLMLQQDSAADYVIGSGILHTLQQLCEIAYARVGLDWREYVISDPAFMRAIESPKTLADITKARTILQWSPKVSFMEMINKMVDAQLLRVCK